MLIHLHSTKMLWSDQDSEPLWSDQDSEHLGNNADRELFLSTLGEACQKTDWQVHAYRHGGRPGCGWTGCWGVGYSKDSADGRQQLERVMEERRGASHDGEELRESATERAERLAREGLRKLGWTETELAKRPKGDRTKLKLAVQLRRETTMRLKWIAGRLRMGKGASRSNRLSKRRRKGKSCQCVGPTPFPPTCRLLLPGPPVGHSVF